MNISNLPEDIVAHISGYYGQKIPRNLSREINGQRLLYAIKENEYYNKKYRTWHLDNVLFILSNYEFMTNKLKLLLKNYVWKDIDKIINMLWWSYSYHMQIGIIEKHFPYALEYEPTFITGREFIKSKTGYYVT